MRANRRQALVAGAAALLAAAGAGVLAQSGARVIKVSARKFVFTPTEIHLRKGEAVILEFVTEDVFMGFNAPDFKVRMDIVPGKVMRLPFTPDKAGTFVFLCDVFCGDGHESMSGKLQVT
jgi:cytochrome c oxidase subunit 2